ncbi:MAG: hypothetical protein CVV59_01515 [Tenericutes bacterium HGW-Tenericutes-4]|nr:MAG: hypothetical protein CVV59_01515 [Tenericutes bacterium HGW-Tenericutes-4]
MAENEKKITETKPSIRCSVNEVPLHKNEKKQQQLLSAFEHKKDVKKIPQGIIEMQQNFNERFYSLKDNSQKSKNNNSGGENKDAQKPSNDQPKQPQQNQELNTLSQIAPMFNLLSGGKNPEIGNLISALGNGNMDMNKMLNNMVNTQMASKSNKSEVKPVNAKTPSSAENQIRNLRRI